jgi:6-phosphogluconolactonase/glucosamine-6-phosphate isomerase/deaminase
MNSPKLPKERISMSYFRLNKARYVYKIVIGKSKDEAVNLWKKGTLLPIGNINGDSEKIYANNT